MYQIFPNFYIFLFSISSYGGTGWSNYGGSNRGFYHNSGTVYRGNNYNTFGYGYGGSNYGYHGSGLFNNHYRSSGGLFGGGKRSFALGAGAGFVGGAMAGVAAMSMYHRYQMYRSMMMYHSLGGYGGYGYGAYGGYNPYGYGSYGHHRYGYLNRDHYQCVGGNH